MKIDILTLFPDMIDAAMNESIIGRGRQSGLFEICCHNIRDYVQNRYGKVDDYPYGGGQGMIMQCQPLYDCLSHVKGGKTVHTVLMSPRGKTFDQQEAKNLLEREHFIIICGHYEGIDQRFIDSCVDAEISLGDFVITGGEIAAMAVSDAVCRMVPGVLKETAGFEDESFFSGLLEYPQYTRPEEWHGMNVPEILLSGHHANITKWRHEMSLNITKERRPDLFEKYMEDNANGA